MFAAGREVIVRGRMAEDGVFKVDELQAKCPSKYDEKRQESEKPK
jgi:cytochrome c-type biogenesis protein CcmE